MICYANSSSQLKVELKDQFHERYYVAVATSILTTDTIRVFSPWRVYTDANGLPKAISTSHDNKQENLFYRARKIDENV